jgi:predicted nucleotidyltransferase
MARMTLDNLVAQLRSAYGDDLVAVVLYGSAAGGEHIPERSDHNVLVIVRRLALETLEAASAVARAWSDAGNPPPLTFSEREWRTSADIFPMEYADILERNRVLHGEPPFSGIVVRGEDLRLQLEQEAMGKVLKLRQAVLGAGGDPKRLLSILTGSLSTLMVIFRAFARLHGERPPSDNVGLALATAARAGFDAAPFEHVIRDARGEARLRPADARGVIAGYLGGLEALVAYLDRFEGGRAAHHPRTP